MIESNSMIREKPMPRSPHSHDGVRGGGGGGVYSHCMNGFSIEFIRGAEKTKKKKRNQHTLIV